MDQHPIPQDVTGFQFKLIGSMTVKQFGYIAVGVVSAVILYYLPLSGFVGLLIKFFLIPLFGIGGVIIAFVPIEGRPIDIMATNFVKAMLSSNQYIYKRSGRQLSFSKLTLAPVTATNQQKPTVVHKRVAEPDVRQQKIQDLIYRQNERATNDLDKKELQFLKSLHLDAVPQVVGAAPGAPAPTQTIHAATQPAYTPPAHVTTPTQALPTIPATPAPVSLPQQNIAAQPSPTPPLTANTASPAITAPPPSPTPTVMPSVGKSPAPEIQAGIIASIQNPQPQVQPTATSISGANMTNAIPPPPSSDSATQATVRPLPQGVGLLHVSDTPNVVMGIVKDPRGNVLHGILVEIKDAKGNPVRAFKTNPLGQFASATQLTAGIYTIELEDPKKQHSFDPIQLITNNQILTPIEITSHDAREELRKQLFN